VHERRTAFAGVVRHLPAKENSMSATKLVEAIDLSEHLPVNDFVLDIIGPTGAPTGWKWTLAAANHSKNTAFVEKQAAINLEKSKVLREAQYNGLRFEAESKTPDQERRESVQWIVARTLSFTPVKIGSDVIEYSDKATEDLLIRPEMDFAVRQVVKALNDDSRFTQRSAKA
jgi:hypothetical protein